MADTMLKHFSYEELMGQDKMPLAERTKLLEPLLKPLTDEAFKRIEKQKDH
ncbi:MAG: hypothetical protein M3R17_00655 [Bacteroidota bacterium]|nr:hypothetical protein [Bacteroidota bacterium]